MTMTMTMLATWSCESSPPFCQAFSTQSNVASFTVRGKRNPASSPRQNQDKHGNIHQNDTGMHTTRSSSLKMVAVPGNLEDMVYGVQSMASGMAASAFSSEGGVTPSSLAVLYLAGLLTSFSPCSLGLLPLTVSYISNATGERSDKAALLPTLAFAAGLAAVFCGLGLSVSLLGGVFGATNNGDSVLGTLLLTALSSGVSIAMGLRLLDLVDIPLPSFEFNLPSSLTTSPVNVNVNVNQSGGISSADDNDDIMSSVVSFDEDGNMVPPSPMMNQEVSENGATATDNVNVPDVSNNNQGQGGAAALFRTFLLGGSSALVASPCATPVLTSILAYVAASRDPTLGTALLVTYTLGYSTPLLVVGATGGEALARAADASSEDSIIGKIGSLVNPLSAGVLIWYGTTGLLTGLFGDPSVAGLAPILD
eukprot:CAMPEP_0198284056 /NCGR_PEP_ID=MMETSP1449-20131203/3589_1 /TAXON_ID=420275 /ORGANISM="Attheya septentrionalis, Strain CCMP2084" /LENGTH=422 /DNA_ID=CAMNT_0043980965 /DNA_START=184 /DNA_END=1452 /DNA_ORIENTATION=-